MPRRYPSGIGTPVTTMSMILKKCTPSAQRSRPAQNSRPTGLTVSAASRSIHDAARTISIRGYSLTCTGIFCQFRPMSTRCGTPRRYGILLHKLFGAVGKVKQVNGYRRCEPISIPQHKALGKRMLRRERHPTMPIAVFFTLIGRAPAYRVPSTQLLVLTSPYETDQSSWQNRPQPAQNEPSH